MGRLAGVISKRGDDVSESIVRMLRAGNDLAPDSEGVAIEGDVIVKNLIDVTELPVTPIALGFMLNKTQPEDPPQPFSQHGYSFALAGRLLKKSNQPSITSSADILGLNPEEGLKRMIKEGMESFAITVIYGGAILSGRDPIGTIPPLLRREQEHRRYRLEQENVVVAWNKRS